VAGVNDGGGTAGGGTRPGDPAPGDPVSDYTVGAVARLAGVSVRTLHHYDQIGLLTPAGRSAAGYRLYSLADLDRLHRILFYRELGFPLDEIVQLMADPVRGMGRRVGRPVTCAGSTGCCASRSPGGRTCWRPSRRRWRRCTWGSP
jgi:hypothetical protein